MNVRMFWLACATGLLSALGANAASVNAATPKLQMQVLSSPPQYVTGGNARVVVRASPDLHDKLEFWLNGQRIAPVMVSQGDRLEGVVEGLQLGPNTLEVRHRNGRGLGVSGALQLTNHPITGPVFSGLQLTPFECRTVQSGLGAPLDAQCSAATRYDWFYMRTSGALAALPNPTGTRPADVASTTTSDGRTLPYIVRVESGTINRSIYRIAVLDDPRAGAA